jgi:pimeloyl-ACP methyl ester carboxylesterase
LIQQRAEQAVWASLGDYDLRPRLGSLAIRALVAHGEDDPIPIATAQATADALGAPLHAFSRCGHVPYIEAADGLFPVLRNFLGD